MKSLFSFSSLSSFKKVTWGKMSSAMSSNRWWMDGPLLGWMLLLSHTQWVLFHSRSQIVTVYPVEWEGKGGGWRGWRAKKQRQQQIVQWEKQFKLTCCFGEGEQKSSKFSWNWVLFFVFVSLSFSLSHSPLMTWPSALTEWMSQLSRSFKRRGQEEREREKREKIRRKRERERERGWSCSWSRTFGASAAGIKWEVRVEVQLKWK